MTIQFPCTNAKCRKLLRAGDQLAGKKARCPHCATQVKVPPRSLPPKVTPPRPAAPKASPQDIEAIAAAALSEEAKPTGPQAPSKFIDFTCMYCDEKVHVPAENAGKQMPCPECGRIVKVPLPAKEGPKDWRQVDRHLAASALRRDVHEQAPEGEWGTVTASGKVSQQSLEEAEAVDVIEEPPPRGRYGAQITLALLVLVLAVLGIWGVRHGWRQGIQQQALAPVLEVVPEKGNCKLPNLEAAPLYRAVGEYYLRAGDAPTAHNYLLQSYVHLMAPDSQPDARDLLLIDLALTEIDLGGERTEISTGARLPWDTVGKDLIRMVRLLEAPEARTEGLRQLSRKLIAAQQQALAETLSRTVPVRLEKDRPEMEAIVGLELVRAGQNNAAQAIATRLTKPYEAKRVKGQPPPPPLGANVLALVVALGQIDKAEHISKTPLGSALKDPYPEIRMGYSQGLAYQDKWQPARELAAAPGAAAQQLEALVKVAAIGEDRNPDGARLAVQAALQPARELLKTGHGKVQSPWLLLQLVGGGARVGLAQDVGFIVDQMPAGQLQDRARLVLLRARVADNPEAATEEWQHAGKMEKPDPMHPDQKPRPPLTPAMAEFLARALARGSSSPSDLLNDISDWEPLTLRPFGDVGVALGDQESAR